MKKSLNSPFFAPVFVVLGTVFIFIAGQTFFKPYFRYEHYGVFPFEQLSDVFWVVLLCLIVFFRKSFLSKQDFGCTLFLSTMLFLRELGAQHWLPSKDTTAIKIRFFTNPENPLHEKIISGAVILLAVAAAIYLLKKYIVRLFQEFFKFKTFSWTMATFGGWGIFCKIVDRFPSLYSKKTGVSFPPDIHEMFSLVEESSEMFLPVLAILALYQFRLLMEEKA